MSIVGKSPPLDDTIRFNIGNKVISLAEIKNSELYKSIYSQLSSILTPLEFHLFTLKSQQLNSEYALYFDLAFEEVKKEKIQAQLNSFKEKEEVVDDFPYANTQSKAQMDSDTLSTEINKKSKRNKDLLRQRQSNAVKSAKVPSNLIMGFLKNDKLPDDYFEFDLRRYNNADK